MGICRGEAFGGVSVGRGVGVGGYSREESKNQRGTKPTHRLAPAVRQDTKYR